MSTINTCGRNCAVCGRNLAPPGATGSGPLYFGHASQAALHLRVDFSSPVEAATFKTIYPELTIPFDYTICWVCSLRALGIPIPEVVRDLKNP